LSRYVHNASQKDSYICREIAREEKKEKEKERGRGWKSGSAREGGTIDGKKARFCRHVGETLDRIFTHMYALTRIVSVVQT